MTLLSSSVCALVAGATLFVSCKQATSADPSPSTNSPSSIAGDNTAPTGTAATNALDGTAASSLSSTIAVPEWAIGNWAAVGTTTVTPLQLPNNQGVQLAWIKDKGKQHTGEVRLSLTLSPTGAAIGELDGVLGSLSASGAWPARGPLHLELRPTTEGTEVFHGTLTISWDAENKHGHGVLRASTGDGHWLRAAALEVTRPS